MILVIAIYLHIYENNSKMDESSYIEKACIWQYLTHNARWFNLQAH